MLYGKIVFDIIEAIDSHGFPTVEEIASMIAAKYDGDGPTVEAVRRNLGDALDLIYKRSNR